MTQTDDLTSATSFDALGLPDHLRQALRDVNYETPTPVQTAVFGPATAGKDLVVQARTGTGKTCAFSMPLIADVAKHGCKEPRALVLCPTRELALQVSREMQQLAAGTNLNVVAIYGGAPMQKQIDALSEDAAIIVGTPGRVLDHLRRGTLVPTTIRHFVLDECDEMLSMGFLPQITEVWEQLPESHQVLLFSATVPREVMRIAQTRLKEPEFLTLSGDQVGALEIQHFVYMSQGDRTRELLQVVEVENPESAIVFCNTRDDTKRAAAALKNAGFAADWLNADLSQKDREKVMQATREGKLRFLVCTDVAARGIDISHLTHVINFDFPEAAEQYVHRTGRTGRAGRMGTAVSLVTANDIGNLYHLRLLYKIRPIERQLPSSADLRTREEADVIRLLSNEVLAPPPARKHIDLARRLLTHDQCENIVAGLLRAHFGEEEVEEKAARARREQPPRPVEAEPDAAPPKAKRRKREDDEPRQRDSRRPRGRARQGQYREEDGIAYHVSDAPAPGAAPKGEGRAQADAMEKAAAEPRDTEGSTSEVYVNVGKRDGARAEHFRTLLVDAGIDDARIDYVNVRQSNTFVGVSRDDLDAAIAALNGKTIADRQALAEPSRSRRAS